MAFTKTIEGGARSASPGLKSTVLAMCLGLAFTACSKDEDEVSVAEPAIQQSAEQEPAQSNPIAPPEKVFKKPTAEDEQTASDEESEADTSDEAEAESDLSDAEFEATEPEPEKIVFRKKSEGYLEWLAPTETNYNNAEVNVTLPNGVTETYRFESGEPIVLQGDLADGLYQWESVITPQIDETVMADMREVRERGNLDEINATQEYYRSQGLLPTQEQVTENRQSGAFRVHNGVISATRSDGIGPDKE